MSASNHRPFTSITSLRVMIQRATIALAFCAFAALSIPTARAQTFNVIYSFGATTTDGTTPVGKLVLDAAGNLYGTTMSGGTRGSRPCQGGCGTIFKIDATGKETVLYTFTDGADGAFPDAGVILDPAGNLYGTASSGGNLIGCQPPSYGCGTVFKLAPDGTFTTLHKFAGGSDGEYPQTGLVSFNGELYGTTSSGGDLTCNAGTGCGTIFKISKSGKKHVLYRIPPALNLIRPGNLVTDSAGNLYGNVYPSSGDAGGAIFKLDGTGTFTVLYTFPGGAAGSIPYGRLLRDINGNIHGVTLFGGNPACNCGTLFRVDSTGTETVLHRFGKPSTDGQFPEAGVVDAAGVLYGTTAGGGNFNSACGGSGCGTVFRIAGDGAYSVLYSFTGGVDGSFGSNLTLDAAGNLYGIAIDGPGGSVGGVVFKITP